MPTVKEKLAQFRNEYVRDFKRIEWNTTPGDAVFLRILIESSRAKRGLEIGTATGYGAMLMGMGFERTGGRLTCVDPDPEMVVTARDNIRKMRLQKTVSIVRGDALKVVPKLPGKFDFVFIDAFKEDYLKYFQAVVPKLKRKSIIVADNVIQRAEAMPDFLQAVREDPHCRSVTVQASAEKGDGMLVIYRTA
jgi:predicted O-methyltransferase YrrM